MTSLAIACTISRSSSCQFNVRIREMYRLYLLLVCVISLSSTSAVRNHLKVWQDNDFQGTGIRITYMGHSCVNFNPDWRGRVSSAETHEECVTLYAQVDCSGHAVNLLMGSPFLQDAHEPFSNGRQIIKRTAPSSFRLCDLDESSNCPSCPLPQTVGSPEYKFWRRMFSIYSNSRLEEYESRASKSNGVISWDFLYDITEAPERIGDQYRDALDLHVKMIHNLKTARPGTGPFDKLNINDLLDLARLVVIRRAEEVYRLEANWRDSVYTMRVELMRKWTKLLEAFGAVVESWHNLPTTGSGFATTELNYPSHPGPSVSTFEGNGTFNTVPKPITQITSTDPSPSNRGQPRCKPLSSPVMELLCNLDGITVPCDRPALPGTKVQPKCRLPYRVQEPSEAYLETECRPDGEWESPLFKCQTDCGLPYPKPGDQSIEKRVIRENPWHAAIYKKFPNFSEDGLPDFIGAGTIIGSRLIVTAAHNVYELTKSRLMEAEELTVAVGKLRRSWFDKDPDQQVIEVERVIQPRTFTGLSNNYDQDIAVLYLTQSIKFTETVLPVCVPWKPGPIIKTGTVGKVVGWSLDSANDTLEASQVLYIDYDTCRRRAPEDFRKYITYDKFCAGSLTAGGGVKRGYGGGGLTFKRHNLSYLHGIISVKPADFETFAGYTNITSHIAWLRNLYNLFNPA